MKNGSMVVFKKELARFFGDKRLFFMTVLLPGLIIYIMYSIMGTVMTSSLDTTDDVFEVAAVNMPQSFEQIFPSDRYHISNIASDEVSSACDKIREKEYDLCIIFPDGLEEALASFSGGNAAGKAPNVEIYYNSANIKSGSAFSEVESLLDTLEDQVSSVFNINYSESADDWDKHDLSSEEELSGKLYSMIIPMLIMVFIYSSCVSLAPESIAGEKERGTIASLLITPIPRNQIIIGKVMALTVMAILGGLSSFLGTMLSLPKLVGMTEETGGLSAEYYSVTDYIMLALVIVSTALLFITVISILSTIAKTVKEASTMVTPLMMIVMLVSVSSMMSEDAKAEFYWYFIPTFNSVQSMIGIFLFSYAPINIMVTVLANVLLSALGMVVLTRLFNSENVMFGR